MEAQCWICPKCFDDHARDVECKGFFQAEDIGNVCLESIAVVDVIRITNKVNRLVEPLLVEKKALQYHVDMAEHEIDRLKKENAILMERLLRAT